MTGDPDDGAASERLYDRVLKAMRRKTFTPAQQSFIGQVQVDWRREELPESDPDDFAVDLAEFWRFAEGANPAEPQIRLRAARTGARRPLPLDLLEIVQEDRPFLVDTVMGEVAEAGLDVRAMFHPVVRLAGMDLSMILVVLAPVGEDRRAVLMEGLRAALSELRMAVEDFSAMTALMRQVLSEDNREAEIPTNSPTAEGARLLEWLADGRFVFLGARTYAYPRSETGGFAAGEPMAAVGDSYGVLRDPSRSVLRRESEPSLLAGGLDRYLTTAGPVVVAKSDLMSRVHRRALMDYVGVVRRSADGEPIGEVRFVGLFTLDAYEARADETPLVRKKVEYVLDRLQRTPSAHTAKRVRSILETYPRDELYQISEAVLYDTALAILHLYDRPRVRLFARRDDFGRFISVLVFVPRDRYDSAVMQTVGTRIATAWSGRLAAVHPYFSVDPMARVHFRVAVTPGEAAEPDLPALEAQIAAEVRTWADRFESLIRAGASSAGSVSDVLSRYAGSFPAGYRDRNDASEALIDLSVAEGLTPSTPLRIRAYRRPDDGPLCLRIKLYHRRAAVPLADVLPILDHMGLKALSEDGSPIARRGPDGLVDVVWIHEFELEDTRGEHLVFEDIRQPFEEMFLAVWEGRAENDGFNRLSIELGLSWREAALMRALARYRQQTGLDPSQSVQTATLSAHPRITRLILDLFKIKFDPAVTADVSVRGEEADKRLAEILEALQTVESLDADRVLRRLAGVVHAMTRTNYFQTGADGAAKPSIAFKLRSREIVDLPAPRPYREIFVCAPDVEGVHLRFGRVARGGIRWSDRRDDFRTEVLGLVKAQQVKNAVIVPVGAKGGFYPKALPRGGGPDERQAAAIAAYRKFLCGLLDITDNLDARGRPVRPAGVIAHEDDDPYLVVAADKGTAAFSDIANATAVDYGFWLGDAFASGGSVGYDHKAMGITARGAWEAVKRHFRELGVDVQSEPFTVLGVGDMSGDVFGNGALLSRTMKLIAAFDHRHIFIDPDPDPAQSWAERRRLFETPRSTWDDYDRVQLSAGGGVYSRSRKLIALSPQARRRLQIAERELTPADLIRAVLRAEADLLYLGGVGTYVKAAGESQADVGDKMNDAVRVDATDLRVRVVAEGANLGVTQAGRIAFARAGGRIDTDAIDNSAGVDTSDHEVNIKILVAQAEKSGALKPQERAPLLFSLTKEVGLHVLSHNYSQTLSLSLQEASAAEDLDAHGQFMAALEAEGRLDRSVEGLPQAEALAELRAAGRGLSRPELAVITAYGKLELSAAILASAAPDDPYFERILLDYFPRPLARFDKEMKRHRLRREIIATGLANAMVDLLGPTFAARMTASPGGSILALTIAFEAARRMFRLDERWRAVDALDLIAPATGQLSLYQEIAQVLRGQIFRLIRGPGAGAGQVQKLIDAYRPTADALMAEGTALLSPFERAAAEARGRAFVDAGAPQHLAETVALLPALTATVDIADLARSARWETLAAARLHHAVGETFGFERLRAAAATRRSRDPYERQAVRELIADMAREQTLRARAVMALVKKPPPDPMEAVAAWTAPRQAATDRARSVIAEIESSADGWSFAKLTLCMAALKAAGQSLQS